MTIEDLYNGRKKIIADDGRGLAKVGTQGKSNITEVYLSSYDSPSNWCEVEYGIDEPEDQPVG